MNHSVESKKTFSETPEPEPDSSASAATLTTRGDAPSLLGTIRSWLKESFGSKSAEDDIKDAIDAIIEDNQPGDLSVTPETKAMLENILSFGQLRVADVMTPRVNVVAVEEGYSLEEIRQLIVAEEHTRMPVYRRTIDDVTGFVHIKDLIKCFHTGAPFRLADHVREILVVPPPTRVIDLLVKMRLSGVHMALVVDEYGGTDGLVTLEDLFEEIVGKIQDEHDEDDLHGRVKAINGHEFEIDALAEVEALEEFLDVSLTEGLGSEDYDTLGGLVFSITGKMPENGQTVELPSGIKITIMQADNRRIHKVRLVLPEPTA